MRKFQELIEHFNVNVMTSKFVLSRMITLHNDEMTLLKVSEDDDIEVFVNSKEKNLSLMFEYIFNIHYEDLENGYNLTMNAIAERIYSKYYTSWLKLFKALSSEYNPVQNYNMVEDEKIGSKISNKVASNTYGFNTTSDDGVPNSNVNTTSEGKFDDNHRHLTREGNIGVMTNQQMEMQSIELFKYKFLEQIYEDINDYLFSPIY